MVEAFRFQQFQVEHHRSAHKVGTDGVLLGAWAQHPQPGKILDIGTGSGLVALMLAQRFRDAEILGLELDLPSAREAAHNFKNSPFAKRLLSVPGDYLNRKMASFDLIVSNPPYFEPSPQASKADRKQARHQERLEHGALCAKMRQELQPDGRIALILPTAEGENLLGIAAAQKLFLRRLCRVRSFSHTKVIRFLMEFSLEESALQEESLTLYASPGQRSLAYQNLCADFYL